MSDLILGLTKNKQHGVKSGSWSVAIHQDEEKKLLREAKMQKGTEVHKTIEDILNINWKSIVNNWQFSDQLLDNNQNTEQANLFVDKLTEHFLQLYASNNTNIAKEIILMKISNVINLEDYVQVEKYLKTLAVVNNLHATKFQPGEVEFEIVANGGKQAIQNSISTNNLLQENYNHQSADNTLLYTLNFS